MKKQNFIICEACHEPMQTRSRARIGGQVFNFHGLCPNRKKVKGKHGGFGNNSAMFKKPRKPEIIAHHKMAIGGRDPF